MSAQPVVSTVDAATGRSVDETARTARARRVLAVLALVTVLASVAFLVVDVKGSWSYALDLRGRQLGALVVVGAAVGASSLVFQTVAGSRILTPGVMGFDTLYVLVQTLVVYVLGSGALQLLGVVESFILDTVLLSVFGVLLFGWLFRKHSRNLFVLVLVGIILGSLFASLSTFASRMLSPDDYLTLQSVLFASFTTVNLRLLLVCAATAALGLGALVPLLRPLDVVDLGRDPAVALGVRYRGTVTRVLLVVTVLVSTSTALVGPMLFLGLLVANLARQLVPSHAHRLLVPAAALTGAATTVLGQLVVTHLLDLATPLSVVVNLVGGVYFILLLLRSVRL